MCGYEMRDKAPAPEKIRVGREWMARQIEYHTFSKMITGLSGGANQKMTKFGNPVDHYDFISRFLKCLEARMTEKAPEEKQRQRTAREGQCERLYDELVIEVPKFKFWRKKEVVKPAKPDIIIVQDDVEVPEPKKKKQKKVEEKPKEDEKVEAKPKSEKTSLLGAMSYFEPVVEWQKRTVTIYGGDALCYNLTTDASTSQKMPTVAGFYMDVPYDLFADKIDAGGWSSTDVSSPAICVFTCADFDEMEG